MVGISDVARRAGVSTATVSRALSGNGPVSPETRRKVQAAAGELGYVVSSTASGLASGRTKNIGVVVPLLNRWFYSNVVEGAQKALLDHGYDLTLYNLTGGGEQRRRVLEHFLLRQRVDAVIAVSLELTEPEVGRLHALGKPLVGVGGPIPGVRTLAVDDVAVARLATEHLLGLGHTRVALIGDSVDVPLPRNRRFGYQQALAAAGIGVPAEYVQTADFTMEGGYRAARQLLESAHERPTAIFAASDEMAIGSILAARDLGLVVPRDLSVIGVDDHELAAFFGLSTIAQFPQGQGEMAVEILMDQLQNGEPRPPWPNTSMPFELVARASTASPV